MGVRIDAARNVGNPLRLNRTSSRSHTRAVPNFGAGFHRGIFARGFLLVYTAPYRRGQNVRIDLATREERKYAKPIGRAASIPVAI